MMKDGEMLDYIHKTAAMGSYGIRTVLPGAGEGPLGAALRSQMEEYDRMCRASAELLKRDGKRPKRIGSMAKLGSRLSARMQTMMDPSGEKIAEMMIQGNTMGMTKSLRHLRDYRQEDGRVRDLAEQLLKTEEANIQQMKGFL